MLMLGKSARAILDIERAVLQVFGRLGLTYADIRTDRRDRKAVDMRRIIWMLLREQTALSTTQLGLEYRRDHSTIIYGVQFIRRKLIQKPRLQVMLDDVRSILATREFSEPSPIPETIEKARRLKSINVFLLLQASCVSEAALCT